VGDRLPVSADAPGRNVHGHVEIGDEARAKIYLLNAERIFKRAGA
jgi:hypothetical protein